MKTKTSRVVIALSCATTLALISSTGFAQAVGKFALHRHGSTTVRRVNRNRQRDPDPTESDSTGTELNSSAPPTASASRHSLTAIPDLVAAVTPPHVAPHLRPSLALSLDDAPGIAPLSSDELNAPSAITATPPPFRTAPNPSQPKSESLFSFDYLKLIGTDTKAVFTAPVDWEKKDWLILGGVTAGIGLTYLFDEDIRKAVQRNRNPTAEHIFDTVQPFGDKYSFGLLGAFYVGGALFHDPKAKAVALDGLSASIIASGLITSPLKYIVGRSRPDHNEGADHFQPISHNLSFPSGHTTQAFAIASVVAEHYDSLWIKAASYGLASMVGYARLNNDAHWASDVVAGAAIGTFVGHVVVHFNEHHRDLTLTPLLSWHLQGVQISWSF